MDQWGANTEELCAEYEMLFCVRDLLDIYERQVVGLYGRVPEKIRSTRDDIEKKLKDLQKILQKITD